MVSRGKRRGSDERLAKETLSHKVKPHHVYTQGDVAHVKQESFVNSLVLEAYCVALRVVNKL